ncbi:hypothetical protein AADZ90_000305 [Aestuariibius sp. 2305UL40-4]|uniref:hypothetical protein n=1 Tax=Aestuariibius violaceus TaxID=3234132 RepID=UPI00347542DF
MLIGQPEAALRELLILRPVRVIRPEMRVTWPPLAERLNFEIGADGRVARVFCG